MFSCPSLLGYYILKVFIYLHVLFKVNSGTCKLCPSEPWDDELGVLNFPRKPAKKPPRVERTLTCVVIRRGDEEDEYLLTQRPNKGQQGGGELLTFLHITVAAAPLCLIHFFPLANTITQFLSHLINWMHFNELKIFFCKQVFKMNGWLIFHLHDDRFVGWAVGIP